MTDEMERDMLREFYGAWRDFHEIPRDRVHRRKQELAAQRLVDANATLASYYTLRPESNPVAKPKLEIVGG